MVERLFFDGIDLQGSRGSVAYTVEFSSLIDANETETGLAFPDVAMPRAEIAVHAAFGDGLPPAAFVECFRLLKYLQFLHGDSRRELFFGFVSAGSTRNPHRFFQSAIVHPMGGHPSACSLWDNGLLLCY